MDEINQISKYNDAGLSISRLHDIWLRCRSYKNRGMFKQWREQLVDAWLELYPDVLRQTDYKDLIKKQQIFMKKVSQSKNPTELYFNLINWQQFLRSLQDLAGKAGVYANENEEGFD
ncbi:hypothetical protein LCGC14_0937020 [marine sediment metagenome]|uniref:Uncharacterized protein n=1 Tax=marine sediment metagenome TaxID=412755 RepID=A0A0F9NLD4_9ZZZZ